MGRFDRFNFPKRIGMLEDGIRKRDELIKKLQLRAAEHADFTEKHAVATEGLMAVVEQMGNQLSDVTEIVTNPPPRLISLEAEDLTLPADLDIGGMRHG